MAWIPVPSGRIAEIPPSQSKPKQFVNRIHPPSGVNRGQKSSESGSSGVSCCGSDPSALAIQMAASPLVKLTYAIRSPSGDQSPWNESSPLVTCSSAEPSGFAV